MHGGSPVRVFMTALFLAANTCSVSWLAPKPGFYSTQLGITCPSPQDYPWSTHAGATVMDVGGGLGGILAVLLERHPSMSGILFDRSAMLRLHNSSMHLCAACGAASVCTHAPHM